MGKVAIVGAGMMGTALCWPLHDNQHTVHLVGTPLDEAVIDSIRQSGIHPKLERETPQGMTAFYDSELEKALDGVDVIVNGVSSFGTDWFASQVGPHLRSDVPVLAVTKGLHVLPDGDLLPLPVYLNQRLPPHLQEKISLNAIAGPCIAHELAARRQTGVVFCGKDEQKLQALRDIFSTPYYHIWTSTDLKEIEICAALKNGYALGVGIAVGQLELQGIDGLASMYNLQAAIFAQSCLEISTLIRATGGNDQHVTWLPGAGDLYVTVFGGRTRQLGRLLGLGLSAREAQDQMSSVTLESVEIITLVADALERLSERKVIGPDQFPLLSFLDRVLNNNEPIRFPWESFFNR